MTQVDDIRQTKRESKEIGINARILVLTERDEKQMATFSRNLADELAKFLEERMRNTEGIVVQETRAFAVTIMEPYDGEAL